MQKSEKEKIVAQLRRAAEAQRRAYSGNLYHEGIAQGLDDAAGILGKVRCKDDLEVVRCKDCVYYEMLNNNEHYCDAIYRDLSGDDEGVDFEPPEDHFCAYGVRRKSDG